MFFNLKDGQPSDECLLFRKITFGDEAAFREIVYRYSPRLISFLIKITKTRYSAEEILQEVFLKLWENRTTLKVDNLGGWLHRVASNLAYNYLKRKALEDRLLSSLKNKSYNHLNEVEQRMDSKEHQRLIYKAVEQLPNQQRKVYQLSLQEGMSRKEIADSMSISPNTVKNHQVKALKFIRNFLSQTTL